MLTATRGAWTGSPTAYAYQWRRCNSSGSSCANVVNAGASSYRLAASDVGQKMRVAVTATNAGGSSSANSPLTAMVTAPAPADPPPTASFTYAPTSPVTGQVVTFNGASSTCPDGPCTYEWSDDGGTEQPIPALWPLGSGQMLSFTFSEAATKYVRLTVTDATGQTATAERNVVVTKEESAPPPPPPAPPSEITSPSISGTPEVGQTLIASKGTWSGSPTSYAYQWQDCDGSGAGCSNVSGATSSNYTPTTGDVGHAMRVMVSAGNAGGSASASSAATAVVTEAVVSPPAAPVNTALPAIGGNATEGQALSASTGSWSGNPTTYGYQWQDCDNSGENCANAGNGTTSSYALDAGDVGHTIRVVVTATNAGGSSSATSVASAVVVATPPPPAAPTNNSVPTIGGTATEGQTLTASEGAWTGSPTAYAYQWQRCDGTGSGCVKISGGSAKTYNLGASDVGSTLRVVVSASNSGGTGSATSAQTATVTAHVAAHSNCFATPGACGYPDPNYGNVGATSPCSSLTASGSVNASTPGQTVQNLNITGDLSIKAANVTVNNVCITLNGKKEGFGITIASGATNALVEHTTIQSSSPSNESTFMDTGVSASIGSCTSGILLNYDVIEGAAESVHAPYNCSSTATGLKVENSYMQAGYFFTRSGAPSHNEDVYLSDSSFTAIHDTMLNAQGQTAVLFGDNNGGTCCIAANNHWIVKNSLLAGGGFMAYWNAKSTSVGSSTMDIENNNWARCTTSPKGSGDGEECGGIDSGAAGWVPFGQSAGADSHGYFPNGGYYPGGLQPGGDLAYGYCPPAAGQTFTGNVWDDNGAAVSCG